MPAPIEGAWLDAFFDALPGRHTAGHFGLPH